MTTEPCPICDDPYNEHVLIATGENPADGGILLCPRVGCQCFATWGINDLPPLTVPEDDEVADLRAKIQKVVG